MDPLIIIPTFNCLSTRNVSDDPLKQYDHQTPLALPGELGRLLESLTSVRGVGRIVILVQAQREIAEKAYQKVSQIAAKFPELECVVVGHRQERAILDALAAMGVADARNGIGLSSYGAIRNFGLVIAQILGHDSLVFLDDDEVIDDPAFMEKSVYGLGKLTKRGVAILAKTGYYLNEKGTFHSLSQNKWYNHYWQQGQAFNAWIDQAMRAGRLSRSNHVCGGCLALHREAFRRVSFDALIARGEDMDYLLNLRMYGSDIWFDNQWNLRHLPPATHSEGRRFRQDIFRWLYEFRKVEYSATQIDLQRIKPQSLEPYPGPFLEPGIEKRIKRTVLLRSIGRPDRKQYRLAARAAAHEAAVYAERNCGKYFEFQYVWPQIMDAVYQREDLAAEILTGRVSFVLDERMNMDPGKTGEIRLNIQE